MTVPTDPTVKVVPQVPTANVDPAVEKTAGRIVRARRAVRKTVSRHAPTILTGTIAAVVTTKMVQRRQDSNTETEDVSDSYPE